MRNRTFIRMLMAIASTALVISGSPFAAGAASVQADSGAKDGKHFDPKGKLMWLYYSGHTT